MPQIVVLPKSCLREPQPVFHPMPFVIGIAQAVGVLAARTLHGQFVRKVVRNRALAFDDFRQSCRHSPILLVRLPRRVVRLRRRRGSVPLWIDENQPFLL
jgi:hypothetical protein